MLFRTSHETDILRGLFKRGSEAGT